MPAGRLRCDAGLVAAGVASSLKEKTGRFGTEIAAMVGRACKLAGGLLPGVNRLPGREAAEEVYKPGVAVVTPADSARDSTLEVLLSWRVNGESWSLMRLRLQGAAPLGVNLGDDIDSRRLRTIVHPDMNSNPSGTTLPRPIKRAENGKVLLGRCAP
jgi:hypothetical protein